MSSLIYKKMSEVMKEVGFIAKAQTNSAQGFKFRGIDQFVNALYPALTKHGVFMAPRATNFTQEVREVTRSNGKLGVDKHVAIMMEYDFWAEDGSKVTIGPIPAEGLDSGDKATNKALSAALKYALIQTFSIPTVDMAEADLDSPELGSTKNTLVKPTPTITTAPITPGDIVNSGGVKKNSYMESPKTSSTLDPATGPVASTVPKLNAEFDAIKPPTQTLEPLKKSGFRKKTATPVQTEAQQPETTVSSDWN